MSLWHSYGSSDAPVAPAVAARPLPGVVAVRALRMLLVAFLCSWWPSRAQIIVAGKYAEKNELKKMLVFFNTSRLLKNVPENLKFRACLLHNVSVIGIKSN